MREIPKKYSHVESENRWVTAWDDSGLHSWDSSKSREQTFVVDTPPPTVSGSLHIGHVFSYTHTDIIVRYQRMCGKNIMYPMGWDDNGLPTERRVQNKFHIRCNPALSPDQGWKPEVVARPKGDPREVSRDDFIRACAVVTEEDEAAFEDLWKRLGLSVDWSQTYATVDEHCRRTSQLSFLELLEQGKVYSAEAPTMWDVDFQTALAQADLEDKVIPGAYHDLEFFIEGGESFVISTTRPELLVSCVAVAAHPSDERYKPLFGKFAITPLFRARVPIVAAEHADPEKGSGILMICTFGDNYDVDWWKGSGLAMKQAIGRDGRMLAVDFEKAPFQSTDPVRASEAWSSLEGLSVRKARQTIVDLLSSAGSAARGDGAALIGLPKAIEHPVKFYEKGEQPIEFVSTRQWFIKILEHREDLLKQGEKISWHPSHMFSRYQHWVEGLNHDWCISRQRFFGVPFPVWYSIGERGEVDYSAPIVAARESLPVDPLASAPPGFDESQRGKPGGFIGDPDVMDTWATSSMTPQIASNWAEDPGKHEKLFPMDIRPQSHEIIRTWAFYTIAKAWFHHQTVPWENVVISGWILDPDRKKMSKSKGNVVTPHHLLDKYSSDAVRYWAGRARLGVDTAFDEKVFKAGQKLVTKLFNASRFVFMHVDDWRKECPDFAAKELSARISEPLDLAFLGRMQKTIEQATEAFERFEYAVALSAAESQFWFFCDHYLELVKGRAYSKDDSQKRTSAVSTLEWSLSAFLRLFAPTLPFVSEEIWSWRFATLFDANSVHRSSWPKVEELDRLAVETEKDIFGPLLKIIEQVRQTKTEEQKTLKWPVQTLEIVGSEEELSLLKPVVEDMGHVARVVEEGILFSVGSTSEGGSLEVNVTLSDRMD